MRAIHALLAASGLCLAMAMMQSQLLIQVQEHTAAASLSQEGGDLRQPDSQADPPWWIVHGVTPEGPDKPRNEGDGFTVKTFTPEQQEHFRVNEFGDIIDQEKHDAAIAALNSLSQEGAELHQPESQADPPWWIVHGVTPEGPNKPRNEGDGFTVKTFTPEQQEHFGVNEFGDIIDQEKHDAAIAALVSLSQEGAVLRQPDSQADPPWWIVHGVTPEGPDKPRNEGDGFTVKTFTPEQQEHFGVNEFGDIIDQEKHDAAIAALKNGGNGDNSESS
eukprot:TRINITY_DN2855_c0_g1_i3.p2 TRINITY_DN2855_c0_g1~~TRINITY_DN2855_c0_g1_i3.p2  ORF type:complete len:275 (+),score=74.44 TRINITY_DN2855_c0_g1_i3:71-895(+)